MFVWLLLVLQQQQHVVGRNLNLQSDRARISIKEEPTFKLNCVYTWNANANTKNSFSISHVFFCKSIWIFLFARETIGFHLCLTCGLAVFRCLVSRFVMPPSHTISVLFQFVYHVYFICSNWLDRENYLYLHLFLFYT